MSELVLHTLEPVYDKNSRALILGTMPSPKSREAGFYYSHPQNSFWRVMATVFHFELPRDNVEKEQFLLLNKLAVWDVLHSCDISGASDSSIKNPVVNDFTGIFAEADIKAVFTTGMTATGLYKKYCGELIPPIYLPSTSPANRRFGFEQLVKEYTAIREAVEQ